MSSIKSSAPIGFTVTDPRQADPSWPRYSARPFPSFRFIPGTSQHPRHNPRGPSYGQEEPTTGLLPPGQWTQSTDYLYGIDLYNYAYWWECHETFEGLWNAAGRRSEQGNFFQAIIQLAAANLKLFMGNPQAAHNLLHRGMIRLQSVPASYMGVDVGGLTENLRNRAPGSALWAPRIRLNGLN